MNGVMRLCLVAFRVDADSGCGVDASAAEPVVGAMEDEDVGVVNDAVDHGGGKCLVYAGTSPGSDGQVGLNRVSLTLSVRPLLRRCGSFRTLSG